MEILVGDARSSATHLMHHISMAKHVDYMKKDIVVGFGGKEWQNESSRLD